MVPERSSWPKEHRTLSHRDLPEEEMKSKVQWLAQGTMEKGVYHLNGTFQMSGFSMASSS